MVSRQSLNSSFLEIYLVKWLFFHTLNFISDSSSCRLGLSNEISFVSGFFLEGGQNSQNVNQEIEESRLF